MLSNVSPGTTIDVIGVLMEIGQVGNINLKTGESKQKREIKVADESNAMISVTLWGDVATAQNFTPGDIFALRGCRVSDYAGRSLNASSSPGDLIPNVKHPRAVAISQWYSKSTASKLKSGVTNLTEGRDGGGERQ